jgi:hypothetical protein
VNNINFPFVTLKAKNNCIKINITVKHLIIKGNTRNLDPKSSKVVTRNSFCEQVMAHQILFFI